jgi:anti-sigma-K factor RskA
MMTHDEFESLAALDAVGAATAEEARTLEAHLASCADCRRARDEFAEAATLLARELPPTIPPSGLRERVLAGVEPDEDIDEEEAESSWSLNQGWLAAAAMLFLALWGWREFGMHAAKLHGRSQLAEIESLKEDNTRLQLQRDKLSAEMSALAARDTRTISLSGQQVSPEASARVFLEPEQRRAIVFFTNLPRNAKDRSYQLWIIRADQPKPQSAGVFDAGPSGNASLVIENLPIATEIKALAVTLEPHGGVEQPTNTNFYLMGNS